MSRILIGKSGTLTGLKVGVPGEAGGAPKHCLRSRLGSGLCEGTTGGGVSLL